MRLKIFRPTNRRIRVLVGLFLVGLFCIQCVSSPNSGNENRASLVPPAKAAAAPETDREEKILRLAREDHIALLAWCGEAYDQRVRDYTCTLVKKERINGEIKDEQHAKVKFLDQPFSVAMHFVKNPPLGERVLYINGKYDGNMLVKPRGWMGGVFGTVQRKPDGPDAMKNTLQPISGFGFENMIARLLEVYRQADKAGELTQEFGGFAEIDGRRTVALVRHLPRRDSYPAAKTITYIDTEYLLPVMLVGYDWDGEFICRYVFKDIDLNTGLTAGDFRPAANDMKEPS